MTASTADAAGERTRLHGPASLLGVAVGLVLAALPFVTGAGTVGYVVLLVVAPVMGLLLLPVPGRPRQLGVGLLASGVAYPVGVAGVLALALVG